MNISQTFRDFLLNLRVSETERISRRYRKITRVLNRDFHYIESEERNSLQVGSYGRRTATKGVSDLDMVFELSEEHYLRYDSRTNNGQSALLQDIKKSILSIYPSTDIKGDGQVVVVSFTNYRIEVCPGFLQENGSYKYPDSNNGGIWKLTKPRQEINEMNSFNNTTNSNLKRLARMCRAWRNKNGVKMGGLLIDTLCYKFLKANEQHWETSYSNYHFLVRDFFGYLINTDKEQKIWYAPGSNQKVYKKYNFIPKARKAYTNIIAAIEKNESDTVYAIWRKVFGLCFPYPRIILESSINYTNNEEFIENQYPVDIQNSLSVDCLVKQQGFREHLLSELKILKSGKSLKFYIKNTDVEWPYNVKWKVKNKGKIAKEKKMLRGQIVNDEGSGERTEHTSFNGEHYVECYIIKDGICVARDRVDVPISL